MSQYQTYSELSLVNRVIGYENDLRKIKTSQNFSMGDSTWYESNEVVVHSYSRTAEGVTMNYVYIRLNFDGDLVDIGALGSLLIEPTRELEFVGGYSESFGDSVNKRIYYFEAISYSGSFDVKVKARMNMSGILRAVKQYTVQERYGG